MNVVCNNPLAYVVEYPGMDAVEIIDKRRGMGVLMRAEAAQRFRDELKVWSESSDPDAFEVLLDHYGALMTQPAVYH